MNFIIDLEDFHRVTDHKWSLQGKYLRKNIRFDGKQHNVYLHHFIIGYPLFGLEVDHINRNPLDNRKSNLRFVTRQENMANLRPGDCVTYRQKRKRWVAQVTLDRKINYLGSFLTKDEALEASKKFKKKTAEQRRKKK